MDITDNLTKVFRTVFDDDSITLWDEMTADDVDTWDSLSHVNLMIAIELAFDIEFKHSEIQNFSNVGELLKRIKEKTSELE